MTHTTYNGKGNNMSEDQFIVLRNLIRNLTHRVDELEKQVGQKGDAYAYLGIPPVRVEEVGDHNRGTITPDKAAVARAALAAKRAAEKEQKPD